MRRGGPTAAGSGDGGRDAASVPRAGREAGGTTWQPAPARCGALPSPREASAAAGAGGGSRRWGLNGDVAGGAGGARLVWGGGMHKGRKRARRSQADPLSAARWRPLAWKCCKESRRKGREGEAGLLLLLLLFHAQSPSASTPGVRASLAPGPASPRAARRPRVSASSPVGMWHSHLVRV